MVIRDILMDPDAMLNNVFSKSVQNLVNLGRVCVIDEWSVETIRSIQTALKSAYHPYELNDNQNDSPKQTKEVTKPEQVSEKATMSQSLDLTPKQSVPVAIVRPMSEVGNETDLNQIQFEHVQAIRKKYGIGIELNEQTKTVTESLKGKTHFFAINSV